MDVKLRSWIHFVPEEAIGADVLPIEGWVFAEGDVVISSLRARARGKTWPIIWGILRPDVAADFPGQPGAQNSGFSGEIEVKPGMEFELIIEAQMENVGWKKALRRQITIPPDPDRPGLTNSKFRPRQRKNFAYYSWLDEPVDWEVIPRRFRISGWCFPKLGVPITAIRARIGRKKYDGNYGVFRADVAELYQERAGAFKSGFEIVAAAPKGRATLRVEARREDGAWEEVFVRRIRAPWINRRPLTDAQLWEIGDYRTWIERYDTLSALDREQIRKQIDNFPRHPLISIVMPVYNPTRADLERAIRSVSGQLYPHWELCIVDDGSTARHVAPLLVRWARRDSRIKFRRRAANGGIAAASNDALALAQGEFIALLDHDDEIVPSALYFVAQEILQHPDAQLIYSDEDKLDILGQRCNPHFKPDWNSSLFLTQNYFSHLGVFRAELIKSVGFRAGFEGSQDYDLVLRCSERVNPGQIRHIPRILYHWRMTAQSAALTFHAKPEARTAATRAVEEHLARRQIAARVTTSGDEDFRRVRFPLPNEKPSVSIVILTRDRVEVLRPCLESILEKTLYPNYELVVIDHDSREPESLGYLAQLATRARVRVLRAEGEFSFGRLNNLGVAESKADFVALLNNDLQVISPDWLGEMVSQALQQGVGAAGARLLYPDGRIQHAGVILGGGGIAAHAHKGLPRDNHGYFARTILVQEFSAVTAACLLVRRNIYQEAGGFEEEHLKVAFNDVDFCLRLRRRGYRIVYTPYAEMYHFESASRGLEDTVAKDRRFQNEIAYMRQKWGSELERDPAYNANLSLVAADFTLAFPPRISVPWRST